MGRITIQISGSAFYAPVHSTPSNQSQRNSVLVQKVKLIQREEADLILQSLGEGWAVHKVRYVPLQTGIFTRSAQTSFQSSRLEEKGMWV